MQKKRPSFDVAVKSAIWGSKHTSKANRTSPIICINPGGDFSRTDKIFPATGKAILANLEEFIDLLKEQARIVNATSATKQDDDDAPADCGGDDDSSDEGEQEEARPMKKSKKVRK